VGEERDDLFYYLQLDYPLLVSSVFSTFSMKNAFDDIWHYRLGHLSSFRLHLLQTYIPKISVNNKHICIICHLTKQRRLHFFTSYSITRLPFELIHCHL
jgi:hypothetical protein